MRSRAARAAAAWLSKRLVSLPSAATARICSRWLARTLLVLAAKLVEPGDQLGHAALALGQRAGDLAMAVLGRLHGVACLVQLLLQVAGAGAHGRQLPAMAGDLLLQVAAAGPLVLDGRFGRGDPLAVGGDVGFGLADLLVDFAELGLGLEQLGLAAFGLGDRRVALVGQRCESRLPSRRAARLSRCQSTRPTWVRSSWSRSVYSL